MGSDSSTIFQYRYSPIKNVIIYQIFAHLPRPHMTKQKEKQKI